MSTSDSITSEPAHAEIECNKSDLKQPDDRLLAAANDLRETAARLETTADTVSATARTSQQRQRNPPSRNSAQKCPACNGWRRRRR